VLPSSVIRKLSEEEMEVYCKPFAGAGEDRRPTLTWPRMIPIEGEPAKWSKAMPPGSRKPMSQSSSSTPIRVPFWVGRQRELCRAWPNQTEVTVKGRHFLQEDSPDEIGQAVAGFVRRVRSHQCVNKDPEIGLGD
jgi:haloalkane dehalogenase